MCKCVWHLIELLLSLAMLSLISCGGGSNVSPQVNHPPEIIGIDEQGGARPLASEGKVVLRLNVTDEDADTLTITAEPFGGGHCLTLLGDANRYLYTAPDIATASTELVTFTVSDGHGGTDTADWTVDVIPPEAGNGAQTDFTITLADDPTAAGDTVVATCHVTDPDGDAQAYTYTLEGPGMGELTARTYNETAANVVEFAAPAAVTGASYLLTFYADDGHGHTIFASTGITVTP
jgi:large repetitive protein